MSAVKQVSLVPVDEPPPALTEPEALTMIERLARDPNVDVEKLERLIAMQERILDRNNKAAFDAAFAQMQPEIPTVIERGKTDKARYALLEDIVDIVRPILQKHGFSISFRTEWPDKKTVKVIGILTHREGHARESEFLSEADASGSKNAIQGLGSAVSYGHRYTIKDLLNITSKGEDDDGARAANVGKPEPPDGYDDWLTDLSAVADEGTGKLHKAWNGSKPEYRKYLTLTNKAAWETLKAKAGKVQP